MSKLERPLNALFILPSLKRGGAETQLITLVNDLPAQLFRRHLVSFEPGDAQRSMLNADVDYHFVPRRGRFDLNFCRQIGELIDRLQIDVVHTSLQMGVFAGGLAVARSQRKPPLLAALHTTISRSWKHEMAKRFVFARQLKRAARVLFVCKAQADYWRDTMPWLADREVVVYNGIDAAAFERDDHAAAGMALRSELNIDPQTPVVACIAAFRPEKGHRILLDAFVQVSSPAVLVLAGGGALRPDIEAYAERLGIAQRVRFAGELSDVRPLLAGSQLTVLASTAVETFSIAMLESMAMRVPVLATDIGGLREAIRPDFSGALVPAGNADAMAAALERLLADPAGLTRLGDNGAQLVRREFSRAQMTAQTADVMQTIVRERRRG